jgi:hypothetical protein
MAEDNCHCTFCGVCPHPKHGFIYVIVFQGDIVKIGRSSDPSMRVSQILSSSSLSAEEGFLFSVRDQFNAERALLNFYYNFRLNGGEWFVIPKDSRTDLETLEPLEIDGQTFWPHCAEKERDGECGACVSIANPELVGLS